MFIKTNTDYINVQYIRRIYVTCDDLIRAEMDDGRKITLKDCSKKGALQELKRIEESFDYEEEDANGFHARSMDMINLSDHLAGLNCTWEDDDEKDWEDDDDEEDDDEEP